MSRDIKLVVTVNGPNPWGEPGGRLVKSILKEIGENAEIRLSHLHSSDKPPDWQKVKVSYEVVE